MHLVPESPVLSLRAVMRPAPTLAPEDSLERFLHTIRFLPVTALPVVCDGKLCGLARIQDVLPLLASHAPEVRADILRHPITEAMRAPVAVLSPDTTPEAAAQVFAETGETLLPVADADGYCLGVVVASDLFAPELPLPPPPRIGGMATPFGVYLTDGNHQAGVGNLALISSGAAMALLMLLTFGIVEGGLWLGRHYGVLPMYPIIRLDEDPSITHWRLGVATLGIRGVALIVFLSLMRVTRIAGYHAAEHQTVHALERGERLVPEIVGRMPRPHPRCGTNLMAAGILFSAFWQILAYVPILNDSPYLLAALLTAFVWRPFGTFLQDWFTTRPASEREIASGIAAGEDLMTQYLTRPPERTRLPRRIWNTGMLQTMMGMLLMFGLVEFITWIRSLLS